MSRRGLVANRAREKQLSFVLEAATSRDYMAASDIEKDIVDDHE